MNPQGWRPAPAMCSTAAAVPLLIVGRRCLISLRQLGSERDEGPMIRPAAALRRGNVEAQPSYRRWTGPD